MEDQKFIYYLHTKTYCTSNNQNQKEKKKEKEKREEKEKILYYESKQISQILHKTKSQGSQIIIKRKTHAYNSPLALISMGPCIIISLLLYALLF